MGAGPKRRLNPLRPLAAGFVLALVLLGFIAGAGHLPELAAGPAAGSSAQAASLNLNSSCVLLMRRSDGQVLLEENADQKIYPASMSKIMTAVVAIESLADLEEKIVLNEALFDALWRENAATAGFLPGEEATALDLLYGAMLPSGAECAVGLAEHVAGSEKEYVQLMNDKALRLGLEDTSYANASGLHHRRHYTTARDMARLLDYAVENDIFREIITSPRHATSGTRLHPDGLVLNSTLFSRLESPQAGGGSILGGKTGYTEEAGQCLAAVAELDGEEYILITAGALPGDFRTQQLHIDDAIAVLLAFS